MSNLDNDDDDSLENTENEVQLGFLDSQINELFNDPNWENWDGGKVGGKPIWLDRKNLPDPDSLTCKSCGDPMIFLMEIYCPLDEPVEAFHRAIYVFCCKKAACIEKNSFLALRCQLPQENSFYPASVEDEPETVFSHKGSQAPVCCVCGLKAPFSCSACGKARYCSKSHQALDWPHHKTSCGSQFDGSSVASRAVTFREHSIMVDKELMDDDKDLIEKVMKKAVIWDDAMVNAVNEDDKDEEEDLKLTQNDYNTALGTEQADEQYVRFIHRVERGGRNQILRYCRWVNGKGPLWISTLAKEEYSQVTIPCCPRCGSARLFEFQIMPQLLYYLQVEDDKTATTPAMLANTIDWGTLDIYSCSKSCGSTCVHDAYYPEFIHMQKPLKYDVRIPTSAPATA